MRAHVARPSCLWSGGCSGQWCGLSVALLRLALAAILRGCARGSARAPSGILGRLVQPRTSSGVENSTMPQPLERPARGAGKGSREARQITATRARHRDSRHGRPLWPPGMARWAEIAPFSLLMAPGLLRGRLLAAPTHRPRRASRWRTPRCRTPGTCPSGPASLYGRVIGESEGSRRAGEPRTRPKHPAGQLTCPPSQVGDIAPPPDPQSLLGRLLRHLRNLRSHYCFLPTRHLLVSTTSSSTDIPKASQ